MPSNVAIAASVNLTTKQNALLKRRRPVVELAPLGGVTSQDTTTYTGPWVHLGAGFNLVLTATFTNLTGSMDLDIQTIGDASGNTDPPRSLGSHTQALVNGSERISAFLPTDEYVRIVATPGQGPGQACNWVVRGEAYGAILQL